MRKLIINKIDLVNEIFTNKGAWLETHAFLEKLYLIVRKCENRKVWISRLSWNMNLETWNIKERKIKKAPRRGGALFMLHVSCFMFYPLYEISLISNMLP